MADYDRLPPELRAFLAGALLPWSPRSAAATWARLLARHGGDRAAARAGLAALERRRIARDAAAVWGPDHPAAARPDAGLT